MDYWRPGRPENARSTIDRAVRPFDLFTAPGDLVRYARHHGLQAAVLVDAQLEDLKHLLDQGLPTMVVCAQGDALHYMVAIGYEGEAEIGAITFADPAGGRTLTMAAYAFDGLWRDLVLRGLPTCVSRVLVAIAPPGLARLDALPVRPLQSAGAVLLGALAVKDLAIAWSRRDPVRLVGGSIEAVASLPGTLGSLLAGLGSKGRKRSSNILFWVPSLVLSACGWALQLVGMPCAWAGQALGSPLAWLSMRRLFEDDPTTAPPG